jgi:hypothetical protein
MLPPSSIQNEYGTSYSNRNYEVLKNGAGWCAGAKIRSHLSMPRVGVDFFVIQGTMNFELGFDMTMQNYGPNARCDGKPVGLKGLQGEGNMYLDFHAQISVDGHLKFPFGCPTTGQVCGKNSCCCDYSIPCLVNEDFNETIFDADATALLNAKAPSPLYFSGAMNAEYNILGRVKGNVNFNYAYGNNCTIH